MEWSQVIQVGRRIAAWFQHKIEVQQEKAGEDRNAVAEDLAKSEQLAQRASKPAPSDRA